MFNVKQQLSKYNYIIILTGFVSGVLILVLTFLKSDLMVIALLGIVSSASLTLSQLVQQKKTDIDDAEAELTNQAMAEIHENVLTKTSELENKQKVMSEFLKRGIVKEQELIEALNQQSFIIFYHYNRHLDKEVAKFMPDDKKFSSIILENLGFVPVGSFYGSYFFHVISSKALPPKLDNIARLEAYIKKSMMQYWEQLETNLKEGANHELYEKYKQNIKLKGNLSYFIAKVFPQNLGIGYLNFSSFHRKFLEYCARFTNPKDLEIDCQRFNELVGLASIDFFIDAIDPTDREIISRNEEAIKSRLNIRNLFDYETIKEVPWANVLVFYFGIEKAELYAKIICHKAKQVCPILREFL